MGPRPSASACAILVVAVAVAWVFSTSTAALSAAPVKTAVTVTVGTPTEVSVKLSKSSNIVAGAVAFTVTNRGHALHAFKVCLSPEETLANTCTGKSVAVLPGGRATLTVTLKTGRYEFLATVAGQSIAGKKGLIGIGVKVAATTQSIPKATGTTTTTTTPTTTTTTPVTTTKPTNTTTTPTTPTTTTGGGPVFPAGSASRGAGVFVSAGCGTCHTMAAANATGGGGPDLDDLQPSVSDVENQVYSGGGGMPPFQGQLTNQQIADVAAYVRQSTAG